jgi:hypothetical protein
MIRLWKKRQDLPSLQKFAGAVYNTHESFLDLGSG